METEIPKFDAVDYGFASTLIKKNQPFILNQPEGWQKDRDQLIDKILNFDQEIVVLKDLHNSYGLNSATPMRMKYSDYIANIDEYKKDKDFCYHIVFDLQRIFPELAELAIDKLVPVELVVKKYIVIMFWHSYKGMSSNLHYDTRDNFNFQLKGQKRFLIAPPGISDYHAKGAWTFTGHFSELGDIFDKNNDQKYDNMEELRNRFYDITLQEGEMLYLPHSWWHQVSSSDQDNININFWWSTIDKEIRFPRQMSRTMMTLAYRSFKSKKF